MAITLDTTDLKSLLSFTSYAKYGTPKISLLMKYYGHMHHMLCTNIYVYCDVNIK